MMVGAFVCCNGLLGRTTRISVSHEPHIVVRTTFQCASDQRNNLITVLAESTQRETLTVRLRLLPRQTRPGRGFSEILLLCEFQALFA